MSDGGADFVLRVLRAFGGVREDLHDDLWWRCDGEYAPVTFFVKCSDAFWWGTADLERLTPANVGEMERALADLNAVPDPGRTLFPFVHAPLLFCARVRRKRPQGCVYRRLPRQVWPLFDACGPGRPVDAFNTRRPE